MGFGLKTDNHRIKFIQIWIVNGIGFVHVSFDRTSSLSFRPLNFLRWKRIVARKHCSMTLTGIQGYKAEILNRNLHAHLVLLMLIAKKSMVSVSNRLLPIEVLFKNLVQILAEYLHLYKPKCYLAPLLTWTSLPNNRKSREMGTCGRGCSAEFDERCQISLFNRYHGRYCPDVNRFVWTLPNHITAIPFCSGYRPVVINYFCSGFSWCDSNCP